MVGEGSRGQHRGERQEAERGVQPGTGQAAVLEGNGLECSVYSVPCLVYSRVAQTITALHDLLALGL